MSTGAIDTQEYQESLIHSNFGNGILHWNKPNPLTQNYAQFIDYVDNPKFLAKRMIGLKKGDFMLKNEDIHRRIYKNDSSPTVSLIHGSRLMKRLLRFK